jgi:xanthine dehydrogenase accessory factor
MLFSMRELLTELTEMLDQGRDCVYCSVVETRGSTPQKAGAAMLVFPDGGQRGTLGGGCVEAEVKQRALRVLHSRADKPELMTFCLDDNYGWDDGLICGGRMSILADPVTCVDPSSASPPYERAKNYYRCFRRLVEKGLGCTEAVLLQEHSSGSPAGSRFLFDHEGKPAARTGCADDTKETANLPFPEAIIRHLIPVQERPRPSVQQGVAYLPILPRITVLIVGGGHVGQAVARLAAEVDFDIWVMDDRERYASRDRFPSAQRLMAGDIASTLKDLVQKDINPSMYCLIVTRGHAHDEEALYHLANTRAGYVGMIGSKRKIKLIFEDLIAKGIAEEALAKVHAPLGFAIGSQTVPEIAVSIVAELIACRNLGGTIPEARVRVKR